MTLIIGSPHWKGICFNTDTRVTNSAKKTYEDNAQKMAHIHGGIGMVASEDKASAIMVRESIRRHLDNFEKTKVQFSPNIDLQIIYKDLFEGALKELRNHPYNDKRPIYEVKSKGLIGVNIPDQPLRLNQEECNNLIRVIVEGGKINEIYSKYISEISMCSNGQKKLAELDGFSQQTLYKYEVKLFDDENFDIYKITKVPFGTIVAFGSGSDFNYSEIATKILSYMLFSESGDSAEDGAFHLGMVHHYAEQEIDVDNSFNFRTFGGAIVAGTIETDENGIGNTKILLGNLIDKKTNRVISSTREKNNKLWVTTKEGNEVELEPFPDKLNFPGNRTWN